MPKIVTTISVTRFLVKTEKISDLSQLFSVTSYRLRPARNSEVFVLKFVTTIFVTRFLGVFVTNLKVASNTRIKKFFKEVLHYQLALIHLISGIKKP